MYVCTWEDKQPSQASHGAVQHFGAPAQYFVSKPTSRQCFRFVALRITEVDPRDSLLGGRVSPSQ